MFTQIFQPYKIMKLFLLIAIICISYISNIEFYIKCLDDICIVICMLLE